VDVAPAFILNVYRFYNPLKINTKKPAHARVHIAGFLFRDA